MTVAKEVLPGDVTFLRQGSSFSPREVAVSRVEIGENTVRIWGQGHDSYLVHPYEVVAVERC